MDIRGQQAVILVFVLEDCEACEAFLPKLHQAATPLLHKGFPIFIYQADDERPEVQALMNQYKVEATPTTLLLRHGLPGAMKLEGAVDDDELQYLLSIAEHYA